MSEDLPPGWTVARIGELATEVRNGISAKPDAETGTRILRISAIRPMSLNASDIRFLEGPVAAWEAYRLRKEDLLFTRYNGNPALVGACARVDSEQACLLVYPDKLIRVRLDERIISPAFVEKAVHLGASRAFIDAKTKTSAGQVGISGTDLKQVPVVLPPLPEQRRIVAKLDALQSKSRRAKEALDAIPPLLERFRQSVLAAAFRGDFTADWRAKNPDVEPASELLKRIRTERRRRWEETELAKMQVKGKVPGDDRWKAKYEEPAPVDTEGLPELPEGWCWASVEALSVLVTDGDHNPPKRVPNGIPHLTAKNIRNQRVVIEGCSFVTEAGFEQTKQRYEPLAGDIIITCVGTLGETAIVPANLVFSADRNLAAIRLLQTGLLAPFVLHWLNTRWVQRHLGIVSGSTAQPHLYLNDLRALAVPVAPIEEQANLVDALAQALARTTSTSTASAESARKLGALERAVLAKAFRGELVPQDPNDEPAADLLARIASERDGAAAPKTSGRLAQEPSPPPSPARRSRRTAAKANG